MTPFHCIILCDSKNPSLHVCTLCIGVLAFEMTTETICWQHKIPIALITTLDLKTLIKEDHVYKDTWTKNKANN